MTTTREQQKSRIEDVVEHLRTVAGATYVSLFLTAFMGKWIFWLDEGHRYVSGSEVSFDTLEVLEIRASTPEKTGRMRVRTAKGEEQELLMAADEATWLAACFAATKTRVEMTRKDA